MDKKKYLAIIPARGGSKGILNKNIVMLNNKPLIAYSIEPALELKNKKIIDEVIVSTDSNEIAQIAKEYGANVPFMRPASIADDRAKSVDYVLHALDFYKKKGQFFDAVIILQPTSPLRKKDDIQNAIGIFENNHFSSLISVYELSQIKLTCLYIKKDNYGIGLHKSHNKLIRRQDTPHVYIKNGAIFLTKTKYVLRSKQIVSSKPLLSIMPEDRSVDIDTKEDIELTCLLLQKSKDINGN